LIKPEKNMKVYDQVVEQVRDMIVEGSLKKGDRLPSERDLAEQLNISRSSVREAIRALDVIGLVESRHGGGNYIRESFENSLFEPLSMMFMLEKCKIRDILELRRIMEVETSALAASRIRNDELDKLSIIIEKMKITGDEEINVQLDRDFHYSIARASENFLVINILDVISTLMDTFIKGARGIILSDEKNRQELNLRHESIYKSLSNHDPEGTVSEMRKHFDLIEEYLKDI
jgi:GntR family transcriptional regulator, transcriptional repressor for pyruvate dehydrogenase complex